MDKRLHHSSIRKGNNPRGVLATEKTNITLKPFRCVAKGTETGCIWRSMGCEEVLVGGAVNSGQEGRCLFSSWLNSTRMENNPWVDNSSVSLIGFLKGSGLRGCTLSDRIFDFNRILTLSPLHTNPGFSSETMISVLFQFLPISLEKGVGVILGIFPLI